jgi:hypothetical protein
MAACAILTHFALQRRRKRVFGLCSYLLRVIFCLQTLLQCAHYSLHKRPTFRPLKFQLVLELKHNNRPLRRDFYTDMLNRVEEENSSLDIIVFSDEATFHLTGMVNHHNLIIWGSQNPHQVIEHVQESQKVNVFSAVSRIQVYGKFVCRDCHYGSRVP